MIICMFHSNYRGITAPKISCRNCCRIFLDEIKRRSGEQQTTLLNSIRREAKFAPGALLIAKPRPL